jgi:type I restriction enzyme S subunit
LKSFDQLFNYSTGKNIKQDEASPWFDIPCVRYGELYHLYDEVISDIVNYTNIPRSELHFSNGDEILLPSAGEDPLDIGSASALIIKNVAIGRTINILRPKEANLYNQIFVVYYINTVLKKKIAKLAKGNSISNVYNSDLKSLSANLPTLAEQRKIADFLTTVDKKIASIDKRVELLQQYKKSIMRKVFTQKTRFVNTDGSRFPDWKVYGLGQILEKARRKNRDLACQNVQSISNVYGFINQTEYFNNHSIASKDLSNYYVIEKGVFAYNPSRIDVGSLAYKSGDDISIVSPLYVCFRARNKLVSDNFLLDWFSTDIFVAQMNNAFEGSVRNTLSFEALSRIKICLPDVKEQQRIINFFNNIDTKIQAEADRLANLEKLKKALLQRMFV